MKTEPLKIFKVSVILPVYNAEKHLKKCLDSIVNQTLKEIEIIIIDDGSTDSSSEICKRYLNDKRVSYYYKENEGLGAARQDGILHAKGEYIGFVDSDDWIEPEMYDHMYRAAKQEDADLVVCGVYWNEDQARKENFPKGVYNRERIETEVLPGYLARLSPDGKNVAEEVWNVWSKLYRAKLIENHHIEYGRAFRRTQELPFNFEVLLVAEKMVSISDDRLYHWRVDNNYNSLCRGYTKNYWKLYIPLIKQLYKDVENYSKQNLIQSMHLCAFFLSSWVLRNEWVYTDLKRPEIIEKLDELAKDSIIKSALNYVPKEELNAYYQSDYDALKCTSGIEMYNSLKNHSYYKKFRRPIRIKRKLSKYKLFTFVYPKFRKKLIKTLR